MRHMSVFSAIPLAREQRLKHPASRGASVLCIILLVASGCGTTRDAIPHMVWPPAPDTPRIAYKGMITKETQTPTRGIHAVFSALGGEQKGFLFSRPQSVTVSASGEIYVTDIEMKRVTVFDAELRTVRTFGDRTPAKLQSPVGIALADSGAIYVADSQLRTVLVFDAEGNFLTTFGDERVFVSPTAIAVHPVTGNVFVVDTRGHCVRVYSQAGVFLFQFGRHGDGNGEFNFPTGIAIRGDDVAIVDALNARVQLFASDGQYKFAFGERGTGPGRFSRPKSIAVDTFGHYYITDAAFDNVQVFDDAGRILMFLGKAGSGIGDFQLPSGICIDAHNGIYVVDQLNSRIQIFSYLGQY